MNSKHRATLKAIYAKPTNPNINWLEIESLLIAIGCRVNEKKGSLVTFEKDGVNFTIHRPHPHKYALRYRINIVREFLKFLGVK